MTLAPPLAASRRELDAFLDDIATPKNFRWAGRNFLPTVERLIVLLNARDVMEIGGGRYPSLTKDAIQRLGITYTSNDISSAELAKAPEWVSTAHFDLQTPDQSTIAPFAGAFDLVFSKMVMEHIPDHRRAYRNIYTLLRPGGVGIAFHPVYYALPFVANKLLPEQTSRKILQALFPHRNDDDVPKFPAHYDGCAIAQRVAKGIETAGFSSVVQVPFFGHDYYRRFPIIRDLHRSFSSQCEKRNVSMLASYSYTIVVK